MPRLVIIDPDEAERRSIAAALISAGFETLQSSSSVEGLLQVLDSAPHLIILAEEIPPLQAAELLVILTRVSRAPIIVLGGGGEPEEVSALESGADSYFRRRASLRLLTARANALLRRYPGYDHSFGSLGPIPIPISLTPTERRLLICLSNHDGRPVSLEELRVEVWGERVRTDTAKYYLRRLQHKLKTEQCGLEPVCIRGIGYRLVATEVESPTRMGGTARIEPSTRHLGQAGIA